MVIERDEWDRERKVFLLEAESYLSSEVLRILKSSLGKSGRLVINALDVFAVSDHYKGIDELNAHYLMENVGIALRRRGWDAVLSESIDSRATINVAL